MNRRRALLIALAVGLATITTLLLARRGRALNAAAAPAPLRAPAVPARIAPVAAPPPEPSEKPLPTWVRLAIVAAALLAFLAVSLLATRSD